MLIQVLEDTFWHRKFKIRQDRWNLKLKTFDKTCENTPLCVDDQLKQIQNAKENL